MLPLCVLLTQSRIVPNLSPFMRSYIKADSEASVNQFVWLDGNKCGCRYVYGLFWGFVWKPRKNLLAGLDCPLFEIQIGDGAVVNPFKKFIMNWNMF